MSETTSKSNQYLNAILHHKENNEGALAIMSKENYDEMMQRIEALTLELTAAQGRETALRAALEAMVNATSNFNQGLSAARELADAALAK